MSAGDDLDALRTELDGVREELRMFAYRASHDLGEPLRTMAGFAQLLERRYGDQLDEEAGEMIGYLVGGAERMREMLDALLEYSQIGFAAPKIGHADARRTARAAVDRIRSLVEERGAQVDIGELPVVRADPHQLERVLSALIANAIVFHEDGAPAVELRAEAVDGDRCRLLVQDRGIGIESGDTERAWEPFVRLHGHRYPGTGLGLALVRRVALGHGWEHELRPRQGGGSVVALLVETA
jgi:light-regulated signal transduction histidine kinase (bacteriophytochrome)